MPKIICIDKNLFGVCWYPRRSPNTTWTLSVLRFGCSSVPSRDTWRYHGVLLPRITVTNFKWRRMFSASKKSRTRRSGWIMEDPPRSKSPFKQVEDTQPIGTPPDCALITPSRGMWQFKPIVTPFLQEPFYTNHGVDFATAIHCYQLEVIHSVRGLAFALTSPYLGFLRFCRKI